MHFIHSEDFFPRAARISLCALDLIGLANWKKTEAAD